MKKLVGKITEEEKNEIRLLYERRNGLDELAKVITIDNNELYQKLVIDLGETICKFQAWWNEKSENYHWESTENGNWSVCFETNEVYLNY